MKTLLIIFLLSGIKPDHKSPPSAVQKIQMEVAEARKKLALKKQAVIIKTQLTTPIKK